MRFLSFAALANTLKIYSSDVWLAEYSWIWNCFLISSIMPKMLPIDCESRLTLKVYELL